MLSFEWTHRREKKTLKICFHFQHRNPLRYNLCLVFDIHGSNQIHLIARLCIFYDTFLLLVWGFMGKRKHWSIRQDAKTQKDLQTIHFQERSDILFFFSLSLILLALSVFFRRRNCNSGIKNYLKQSIKIVLTMSSLNVTARISSVCFWIKLENRKINRKEGISNQWTKHE